MVNGTIRKEGNIFIGQIAIGKYDNGRIKYKRFKGKKKADVIKKMEAFNLLLQQGTPEVTENYLDDCLLQWAKNVKKIEVKPSSYNSIICIITQTINPTLGHYPISSLLTFPIIISIINTKYPSAQKSTIVSIYKSLI